MLPDSSMSDISLETKVAALEKKVSDLEEELDDAQEELADEKKKSKRLSAELDEVQNELDAHSKQLKHKDFDLEDARQELDQIRKEQQLQAQAFKAKSQAYAFVQSILSAPRAKHDDIQASSELVDNILFFILGELKDALSSYHPIEDEITYQKEAYKWANASKKWWLKNKTKLAFIGEFSAGKTTIVNRIISQDNPGIHQLPVSSKETTAIPTYVTASTSSTASYSFLTSDSNFNEIKPEVFEKVTKEMLEQIKGASSLIKYFVVSCNIESLKSISILDTPGFNSNDPEDAQNTIDIINECDALFWVVDVNHGTVNRSSMEIIRQYGLSMPLYLVVNQIDNKSPQEVESVRALIEKQFQEFNIPINEIICFSQDEPIDRIMGPIQSIQQITKEDFIDSLLNTLKICLDNLNFEWQQASEDYQNKKQQVDRLGLDLRDVLSQLRDDCTEIQNIPFFDPEIGLLNFKKPTFKISMSHRAQFDKAINNISDTHINQIEGIFDRQQETIRESQLAYNEYQKKLNTYKLLEQAHEKFKSLLESLRLPKYS